jgi:16S rRNA (cytidine1402-2'-O)-methyltransferase
MNARRACREVKFNAMPLFQMDQSLPSGLYIVATPIGNLGDMTSRAADTLRRADYILAEDKRVSAKLLAHIGAKAPMTPYHDHSDERLRERILADLSCKAVALVSDAGTPLISDPGYKLVRAARKAGHAVYTLPGPSAAIAALTLAGLPTDRFLFLGFLPAKAKARAEAIEEVAAVRASLVLYESGPRLAECLAALRDGLGEREAAVIREITKLHEETVSGSLAELAARYADAPPKGEIVIVVGPPPERAAASDEELDDALRAAMATLSPSRAAADVAAMLGVPKKRAYARALELGGGD